MATKTIAAIVGDFYHKPDPMLEALQAAGSGNNLGVEPFRDPLRLPWSDLSSFPVIAIARENRLRPTEDPSATWATEAHESALAAWVAAGGALAVLHAGLASYRNEGPWWDTVRGGFQSRTP